MIRKIQLGECDWIRCKICKKSFAKNKFIRHKLTAQCNGKQNHKAGVQTIQPVKILPRKSTGVSIVSEEAFAIKREVTVVTLSDNEEELGTLDEADARRRPVVPLVRPVPSRAEIQKPLPSGEVLAPVSTLSDSSFRAQDRTSSTSVKTAVPPDVPSSVTSGVHVKQHLTSHRSNINRKLATELRDGRDRILSPLQAPPRPSSPEIPMPGSAKYLSFCRICENHFFSGEDLQWHKQRCHPETTITLGHAHPICEAVNSVNKLNDSENHLKTDRNLMHKAAVDEPRLVIRLERLKNDILEASGSSVSHPQCNPPRNSGSPQKPGAPRKAGRPRKPDSPSKQKLVVAQRKLRSFRYQMRDRHQHNKTSKNTERKTHDLPPTTTICHPRGHPKKSSESLGNTNFRSGSFPKKGSPKKNNGLQSSSQSKNVSNQDCKKGEDTFTIKTEHFDNVQAVKIRKCQNAPQRPQPSATTTVKLEDPPRRKRGRPRKVKPAEIVEGGVTLAKPIVVEKEPVFMPLRRAAASKLVRYDDQKCVYCDKYFTDSKILEGHINRIHAEELYSNPYERKKRRQSSSGSKMDEHLTDVIFAIAPRQQCQHCRKWFLKANIRSHVRAHTKAKPFKCNKCSSRFTTQAGLRQHDYICRQSKLVFLPCGKWKRLYTNWTGSQIPNKRSKGGRVVEPDSVEKPSSSSSKRKRGKKSLSAAPKDCASSVTGPAPDVKANAIMETAETTKPEMEPCDLPLQPLSSQGTAGEESAAAKFQTSSLQAACSSSTGKNILRLVDQLEKLTRAAERGEPKPVPTGDHYSGSRCFCWTVQVQGGRKSINCTVKPGDLENSADLLKGGRNSVSATHGPSRIGGPLRCAFCQEDIPCVSYLHHMLQHQGASAYTCTICNQIFLHPGLFQIHLTTEHDRPNVMLVNSNVPTKMSSP